MYNPALQQPYYHHQVYGPTPPTMSTPYYYGYSTTQAAPTPRGTFPPQAQRIQGPSYLYYPTPQMDPSTFSGYLTPPPPPLLLPTRHPFPSPSPTGKSNNIFYLLYLHFLTFFLFLSLYFLLNGCVLFQENYLSYSLLSKHKHEVSLFLEPICIAHVK